MKTLIAILLSASICAAFGGQISPVRKPSPTNPFNYGVVAEGRIVPEGKIICVGAPNGEPAVVAQLNAKVNSDVKRGDVLAVLQAKPLWQAQAQAAHARVAQAESDLLALKAENARALAEFDAQTQALDREVSAAKLNADAAMAAAEARLGTLAAQEAQARRLLESLSRARETLSEEQNAAVAAAQATLDAARAAKEAKILKAQLEQATAAAKRALLDFDREIDAAKGAVADLERETALARRKDAAFQAQAALGRAQAALAAHTALEPKFKEALALAEKRAAATLETARAEAQQAQARAELGDIRAPQDGVVLAIYAYPGETIGAQGLCELANADRLEIQAQVYVDDVSRVKLGARATATGAGIAGALAGKVVEISRQVVPNTLFKLEPSAFADQRIVLVRIALDNPALAANLFNAQVTVSIEP